MCLVFGLSLPLLPYFAYARSECSEPLLLADAISTKISCAGPYNTLLIYTTPVNSRSTGLATLIYQLFELACFFLIHG